MVGRGGRIGRELEESRAVLLMVGRGRYYGGSLIIFEKI